MIIRWSRSYTSRGLDPSVLTCLSKLKIQGDSSPESTVLDVCGNSMANWPFHHNGRPTEIVRAEAEYLYDAKGKQILDASGGCYRPPTSGMAVKKSSIAVAKIARKYRLCRTSLAHARKGGACRNSQVSLAYRGYEHFQLTCSGSEGVECAIKNRSPNITRPKVGSNARKS